MRDIDLLTGGLAEKPLSGGLVGPTFACLFGRQFNALRRGDRFWYENDMPPSSFNAEQLSEIRKITLARIICDNGDKTDFVQPSVTISSDIFLNAFQYCVSDVFPNMDLTKWKTKSSKLGSRLPIDDELINRVFTRAKRETDNLFQMEKTLNFTNKLTPTQLMHVRVRRQTFGLTNQSLILEKVTQNILKQIRNGRDREASNDINDDIQNLVFSLPQQELNELLKNQLLIQNQILDEQCLENMLPCDHTAPFRTINGWCNNLKNPEYGISMRLFNRFLLPVYEDGVGTPRQTSVKKTRPLPSARLISRVVHDDIHSEHVRYVCKS